MQVAKSVKRKREFEGKTQLVCKLKGVGGENGKPHATDTQ